MTPSNLRQEFGQGIFQDKPVLGNSGYTNRIYLVIPLLNAITKAENLYNESHIQTPYYVEKPYGV